MASVTEKRIEQLRSDMRLKDIDTAMISIEENRFFMSGYTGEDTQFDESAGSLFITQDNLLLATDSRFTAQAEQEAKDFEIFKYKKTLALSIPEILKKLGSKKVGFESRRISLDQFRQIENALSDAGSEVEMVQLHNLVESQRTIKSADEIEVMKKSLFLAETAFKNLLPQIKPGMTELSVAWMLEKEMRDLGAEKLSFPSIIAGGPNSALPHAIPSERIIAKGEPLLFDWGAVLKHYSSDISRTIYLGDSLDDKFKTIFMTVYEAQQKAQEAIKPGQTTRSVDKIARDHIEKCGFGEYFGHGLGHGVGLAVHEMPRLSPSSDEVLEPGMVVTVEPGIYIPGWGGVRLENMAVVTESGVEIMNSTDSLDFVTGI